MHILVFGGGVVLVCIAMFISWFTQCTEHWWRGLVFAVTKRAAFLVCSAGSDVKIKVIYFVTGLAAIIHARCCVVV